MTGNQLILYQQQLKGAHFTCLLIKEMILRKHSTLIKDLANLQDELKNYLTAEANMEKLIGKIGKAKTQEQAMNCIIMFVPCIMHCKNCVGIKILTMLFIEVLSNFQGAKFLHLGDVRGESAQEICLLKM